jgi:CheY-like chemotaxis protein
LTERTETQPASRPNPLQILAVEDNHQDVLMMREAFQDDPEPDRLRVVTSGVDALALLRHEGPWRDTPHPDLVLLDLKLPRMDGREVLSAIKSDPRIRATPVVVFTSSKADRDVRGVYGELANLCVVKPMDYRPFVETVRRIDEFFSTVVRLPQH